MGAACPDSLHLQKAFYLLYHFEKENSIMKHHLFIFVELFCFVREQIGFKVLVFGPAGPDTKGWYTFLSIFVFWIFIKFLNLLNLNLEVFLPFFHNSRIKITSWFWLP